MKEEIPDYLINSVARAIAYAYACGWEQHGKLTGKMRGMEPKQWADENAHMFNQEALAAISIKN